MGILEQVQATPLPETVQLYLDEQRQYLANQEAAFNSQGNADAVASPSTVLTPEALAQAVLNAETQTPGSGVVMMLRLRDEAIPEITTLLQHPDFIAAITDGHPALPIAYDAIRAQYLLEYMTADVTEQGDILLQSGEIYTLSQDFHATADQYLEELLENPAVAVEFAQGLNNLMEADNPNGSPEMVSNVLRSFSVGGLLNLLQDEEFFNVLEEETLQQIMATLDEMSPAQPDPLNPAVQTRPGLLAYQQSILELPQEEFDALSPMTREFFAPLRADYQPEQDAVATTFGPTSTAVNTESSLEVVFTSVYDTINTRFTLLHDQRLEREALAERPEPTFDELEWDRKNEIVAAMVNNPNAVGEYFNAERDVDGNGVTGSWGLKDAFAALSHAVSNMSFDGEGDGFSLDQIGQLASTLLSHLGEIIKGGDGVSGLFQDFVNSGVTMDGYGGGGYDYLNPTNTPLTGGDVAEAVAIGNGSAFK